MRLSMWYGKHETAQMLQVKFASTSKFMYPIKNIVTFVRSKQSTQFTLNTPFCKVIVVFSLLEVLLLLASVEVSLFAWKVFGFTLKTPFWITLARTISVSSSFTFTLNQVQYKACIPTWFYHKIQYWLPFLPFGDEIVRLIAQVFACFSKFALMNNYGIICKCKRQCLFWGETCTESEHIPVVHS